MATVDKSASQQLFARVPHPLPRGWARPGVVVLEIVALLAAWQVVASARLVPPVFLPSPLDVGNALVTTASDGTLYKNLRQSATTWALGYVSAVAIAVPLGLLVGTFRPIDRLLSPITWSLYAMPIVLFRPMSIVWFGFGDGPIIFLVFVSAVFPILVNTAAGPRLSEPSLTRAARVFGAGPLQLYRKIILPSSVPFIATGLRTAIPASLIGLLVGEILGSPLGLGAMVALGANTFHAERSFAAIIVLVVLSVALLRIFSVIEERVAPWRRGVAK